MFNDHKGYYGILGVQPSATSALIKAAYRVRAMELHPDRNSSTSATCETQRLNEAYQVLGDETRRNEYDATCCQGASEGEASSGASAPQPTTPAARQHDNEDGANDAVLCSYCQAMTLQPRYRELTTVFGYLLGSRKSTRQGIFCAACERKYSAMSTGLTSLFGWWGVHAFFWSVEALYKNLTGSWRFASQDAMLSSAQAFYLDEKGNLELAHAVAVDARKLAQRGLKLTREQRRRLALGYEPTDRLKEVRAGMAELIERSERAGCTKELVRPPRVRQPAFLLQLAFVGALSGLVTAAGMSIQLENRRIEAERARAEQARLEREGLERQRARAIAERQAAELRAMEQPVPPSGLFSTSLPKTRYRSQVGLPRLNVHAPPGRHYFLKLSEWASGAPALTLFIRAGDTVDVDIPFGTYRIRMAAGATWYGEKIRFGPDTIYSQIDQQVAFSVEGDRLAGHRLELSLIRDGNLRPSTIAADQF